jgi:hypothetical protein
MTDRASSAIEAAKKARAALEEQLDAVERAKESYHEAVRQASAAGVPLRAIADELGLSHQRVHQMVGGDVQGTRVRGKRAGKAALTLLPMWLLRCLVVAVAGVAASFASTHAALALNPAGCGDVATGLAAVCEAPTPRFAVYLTVVMVVGVVASLSPRIGWRKKGIQSHAADTQPVE